MKLVRSTVSTLKFVILALALAAPTVYAYPDCAGWKPPSSLRGKRALEDTFATPHGGTVIVVRIGKKILCEHADASVTSAERAQIERRINNGKKFATPAPGDFSAGYAGYGNCSALRDLSERSFRKCCYNAYEACYDPNSANYRDETACAIYASQCH